MRRNITSISHEPVRRDRRIPRRRDTPPKITKHWRTSHELVIRGIFRVQVRLSSADPVGAVLSGTAAAGDRAIIAPQDVQNAMPSATTFPQASQVTMD
jgi:hypothetical protein